MNATIITDVLSTSRLIPFVRSLLPSPYFFELCYHQGYSTQQNIFFHFEVYILVVHYKQYVFLFLLRESYNAEASDYLIYYHSSILYHKR